MVTSNIFKIILVLLSLNLSLQLFAQTNQTAVVYGKIIDEQTGDGLIGANIYVYSGYIGTVSNEGGEFELEVPVGKQTLNIAYVGYEGYAKEIVIEPNDTLKYEVSLKLRSKLPEVTGPSVKVAPYTNFSLELFGTWIPVEGKLKRRKIKEFRKGTEVVFNWRNDAKTKTVGSIKYTDGEWCNSKPVKFNYRYVAPDLISFQYKHASENGKCDENEFWVGTYFRALAFYECSLQFNETKDMVTITHDKLAKYGKQFLTLKRKKIITETAIIKGKITDKKTGEGLFGAVIIFNNSYRPKDKTGTTADIDGNFSFKVPVGEQVLTATYLDYERYIKEITVKPNDTLEYEISLEKHNYSCPWESSIPYTELKGTWEPVYYKKRFFKTKFNKGNTKRKRKYKVSFNFTNDTLPGGISWHNGCNSKGSKYFRHIGNGIIEVPEKEWSLSTLMYCSKTIYSKSLDNFMANMNGNKTKTIITNNDQDLELVLGKKKLVLQKIHDNTPPGFNTELFGRWMPINGKLNGKKINQFTDGTEVVFDWRKDVDVIKGGAISFYKDSELCNNNGAEVQYGYFDDDFISLTYYDRTNNVCDDNKFWVGAFFDALSLYGCQVKFNETKNVVTLQYGKNFLMLKRKE